MTCIVGLKTDTNVYIGGDSVGVEEDSKCIRKDPKVFKNGPFVIGFTTSFRMGQLLMFSLKVPKQKRTQSDYEFMCTTFINAVRSTLAKGGFLHTNEEEGEQGGTFIVAYKKELYIICDDFQVGIPESGYAACGCGYRVAYGSLYTTKALNIGTPEERVTMAIEASKTHNIGVGGNITIIKQ